MSEKDILIQADVSIRKEEEMHELINEMTTLNNKNRYLESQADDINMELREIQVDFEKVEIPTEKEITDATEWPSIRQKLAEAKAFVAFGQKQTGRGSKVLPVALLFIAIAMVGFGLIQSQWFVVIAGGIIGGIGLALYSKKESVSASEFEQMENFIATYSGKEFEMEQLIIKVSDVKLIQEQFDKTFRALELKKLKVTTEIEAYAKKVRQVETTFATFIEAYGFDGYPSPAIVPELFRMIREVQEVIRNIEEVERKKYANEQKISVRIIEVETTLQEAVPLNAMYELLRREFIKLKEEAETAKILKVEIERLQSMFKEIVVLVDTLAYDLRVLMAEANAETEEEFYNAYRIYEEKIRFEAQLEDIESQLEISGIIDLLKKRNDYELLQDTNENEAKLASLQEQSNHLITEKAELVNKRERLLTDQSYGEQRQYFEMKKAELVELAKKWSARQAVLEAIKRTILELKEKKLPEVLQHAQHMFGELTAGKYEALTISEDGYFIAVGSDGMRYSIAELSQATKEQVYIALRLALATSVFDTAPFPIMMDDPFVHFDEERLSRMIKLLHNSNQHQFIYFTCQRKMKEKWNDAVIITI